jgi:uncharacterized protein (TIGR01440 family)
MDISKIKTYAKIAVSELIAAAGLKKGSILVIGCSSSEVAGGTIGKYSSLDAARAVYEGVSEALSLEKEEIYLAVQCCEHLNRALVVERECAEKYNLEQVAVVPHPHAGGAFATVAYQSFKDPCMVEYIKADAGLDIGGVLIGMHLKHVAVPVRLSTSTIGEAIILAARTRPKYIGGERAIYK